MTEVQNGKAVYGCECSGRTCNVHTIEGRPKDVPVIKLVERNGVQMKVCSRCDLSSDKLIKWLVTKEMPFKPFFDYDPLVIALGEQIP